MEQPEWVAAMIPGLLLPAVQEREWVAPAFHLNNKR